MLAAPNQSGLSFRTHRHSLRNEHMHQNPCAEATKELNIFSMFFHHFLEKGVKRKYIYFTDIILTLRLKRWNWQAASTLSLPRSIQFCGREVRLQWPILDLTLSLHLFSCQLQTKGAVRATLNVFSRQELSQAHCASTKRKEDFIDVFSLILLE